jgi:3-oxoadipate enol-lactonase
VPSADVNGARLHYEVAGDGPAVALLHEAIADSRMWDDHVEALAERHRLLRYDLRGFGRSTFPAGPFSNADDLRILLDVAGIDRVALVGASLGARVAVDFAVAHPGRVTALVLVAPGIRGKEWSTDVKRAWEEEEEALESGDLARAVDVNLRTWVDGVRKPGSADPAVRARVAEMQLQAFRVQVPAYESDSPPGPETRMDPPSVDRLGEIAVPTLVLLGDQDVPDIRENAELLATGIPGARLEVFQDVAHMLPMERPEEFTRVVLEFLAESLT